MNNKAQSSEVYVTSYLGFEIYVDATTSKFSTNFGTNYIDEHTIEKVKELINKFYFPKFVKGEEYLAIRKWYWYDEKDLKLIPVKCVDYSKKGPVLEPNLNIDSYFFWGKGVQQHPKAIPILNEVNKIHTEIYELEMATEELRNKQRHLSGLLTDYTSIINKLQYEQTIQNQQ